MMANALVNFRKICSFPISRVVSLEASLEAEFKKSSFRLSHWQFSRKAKCLVVVAIVAVLLVSVFAFLPKQSVSRGIVEPQSNNSTATTPSPTATSPPKVAISSLGPHLGPISPDVQIGVVSKPPGIIESNQNMNSSVWIQVAANAWSYFQPGTGVDPNTGLPYAGGSIFTGFTDWDLGVYIQAIIDAQKMNLTVTDGPWGSYDRINKVLTFLETRDLNSAGYPFQFYNATTGKNAYLFSNNQTVDVVDTGRLFVALNNLRNFNSNLTTRIDNIVLYGFYNNRSNYAALLPGIKNDILTSTSIYSYYFDSGFASFWPSLLPNTSIILDNMFSAGNVTTYGNVSLPEASISCDPLLCSVFELNSNSSKLMSLMNQVYLAHEAYYNATGQYVAFSEGNGYSGNFIVEWVVLPNGVTWNITDSGTGAYVNMPPIIYTKTAFSFLALYNTTFALKMSIYLEQTLDDPSGGYSDGADWNSTPDYRIVISFVGSNTNGLILDAASYYIQNNP